jgi:DNA (cytosine-5)-methyltransferase 1
MVNQPSLNELALFAGAGGGILGGKLLGWRTVCAVEWEPYPASVLVSRQNEGIFPPFPIWDDVQTFDGKPWRGIVDVISGGFPCQDISAAGKGAGIDGERSGMWREMARIIYEVQPRYAFVENSPMLTSRGLGVVLGDLAEMGFNARWGVLGAADIGANHQRDRIWIVAQRGGHFPHAQYDRFRRWEQQQEGAQKTNKNMADTGCKLWAEGNPTHLDAKKKIGTNGTIHNQSGSARQDVTNPNIPQQQRGGVSSRIHAKNPDTSYARWWETEPDVGRMANGVAAGVDRLKAIGNGQVPAVAAIAWGLLNAP